MNLISIAALQNNYIWILDDKQGHCIIIDPGEAKPVLMALDVLRLIPSAILLTHHHLDHIGGVTKILVHYPKLRIYGPHETADQGTNHVVNHGKKFTINGREYITLALPGHTLGHLAFYSAPYLFCGDTIFSAGCGKVLEGTAEQMYYSFQQLFQFPDSTLICCAHEYTLSNLNFARSILPEDKAIEKYQQYIKVLRKKELPSVPTNLQLEKNINLFLRCHDYNLQKKLGFILPSNKLHLIFAELRLRKDRF